MNKKNTYLNIGILAHVDAGKTTLTEAMLYLCGSIKNQGRVDKQDSFLDNNDLERKRGITIFAKEARMQLGEIQVNIIDTPGHIDFGAEMERCIQAMDLAVLVVNAASGIQSHTKTLISLLEKYRLPHFVFINKLDQAGTSKKNIEESLAMLNGRYISFEDAGSEEFLENIAMTDEAWMNAFLEQGTIGDTEIANGIFSAKISPVFGGSALKTDGVKELLFGIENAACLQKQKHWNQDADDYVLYVYKISHDKNGQRLTHVKVLQGEVKNRDMILDEKISQIRLYNGEKYEAVPYLESGNIACLVGISKLLANDIYDSQTGEVHTGKAPTLIPILNFSLLLEEGKSITEFMPKLRLLGDEMPELGISFDSATKDIQVRAMGLVQLEVLQSLCEERFMTKVDFSKGSIIYKESITGSMEGVGHFEPLRHYAEVHLLLEPLPVNSGLLVEANIPVDVLEAGYQIQVLNTLKEGAYRGVLGGLELCDMQIRLISGKSHLKHTSAGDFKEATIRAIRHGLMCLRSLGKTVLLEPMMQFTLEIPAESIGRAMMDLNRMHANFKNPNVMGEEAIIEGIAPASTISHYSVELASYTKGRGYLGLEFHAYEPCHNAEEVLDSLSYLPENDLGNPIYSVFCSHGEGFLVEWSEVPKYMHIDTELGFFKVRQVEEEPGIVRSNYHAEKATGEELMEIFERTYGKVTPRIGDWDKPIQRKSEDKPYFFKPKKKQKEYMLIDGYNVIFSWEDLASLAKVSIDAARNELIERMSNYQAFVDTTVIVVFDAYKVEGHKEEIVKHHNIYVVYTKEAETADHYIEKTVHEIGRKYQVTVVTSDFIEQIIIRSQGCLLLSSKEFQKEVANIQEQIMEMANQNTYLTEGSRKNFVFEELMDGENVK